MARKPKPKPEAPAMPPYRGPWRGAPHVALTDLEAEIVRRAANPSSLFVYQAGELIGAYVTIDAAHWNGANDGVYVQMRLQNDAFYLAQSLRADWYGHKFDATSAAEYLALQVAESQSKFSRGAEKRNRKKPRNL